MTTQKPESAPHIRLAHADDDEFILAIAERLTSFDLPSGASAAKHSPGYAPT